MRLWTITLAYLLVAGVAQAAPLDPSRCAVRGLATPYNDLRLEEDSRPAGAVVPVPNVVANRVRALAIKFLDRVSKFPDEDTDLTCNEVIAPVYRIDIDNAKTLYVSDVQIAGLGYFYFIIYDPKTDQATTKPARVGSKFPNSFGAQDDLVKLPLVSMSKLLRDGARQLVFEERVHNGTVYNGIVYHYFEIGPHLELTRVLSLETRVIDIAHDGYFIDREVRRDGRNRLRLNVYDVEPGSRRKFLGYAILGRRKAGEAFRVFVQHLQPGTSAGGFIS